MRAAVLSLPVSLELLPHKWVVGHRHFPSLQKGSGSLLEPSNSQQRQSDSSAISGGLCESQRHADTAEREEIARKDRQTESSSQQEKSPHTPPALVQTFGWKIMPLFPAPRCCHSYFISSPLKETDFSHTWEMKGIALKTCLLLFFS